MTPFMTSVSGICEFSTDLLAVQGSTFKASSKDELTIFQVKDSMNTTFVHVGQPHLLSMVPTFPVGLGR